MSDSRDNEYLSRRSKSEESMVMGSSSNFGVNPMLYKNLPYDAVRDFTPVTLASCAPRS